METTILIPSLQMSSLDLLLFKLLRAVNFQLAIPITVKPNLYYPNSVVICISFVFHFIKVILSLQRTLDRTCTTVCGLYLNDEYSHCYHHTLRYQTRCQGLFSHLLQYHPSKWPLQSTKHSHTSHIVNFTFREPSSLFVLTYIKHS